MFRLYNLFYRGVRLHTCDFLGCEKAFLTAQQKNVHMKSHTGNILRYLVIHISFSYVHLYVMYKSLIRPSREMKRFLLTLYLLILMFFLGEKNFVCSIENCQKKFTTAQHLKNHMRIHTGMIYLRQFYFSQTFQLI